MTVGYYEESYPPYLWGSGTGGTSLAIGDLDLAQGATDTVQSTTLTSRRDVPHVHGVVTITGGAKLNTHITMKLAGFLPGQDTETTWTVSGADLVGTYPHGLVGEDFPMWRTEDEVSVNHWSADAAAPVGDYPVHTAIVTASDVEVVYDDWTLTIGTTPSPPADAEPVAERGLSYEPHKDT